MQVKTNLKAGANITVTINTHSNVTVNQAVSVTINGIPIE